MPDPAQNETYTEISDLQAKKPTCPALVEKCLEYSEAGTYV